MNTALIITMAVGYLASMAAMTGYALKVSRMLTAATRSRNDWRDHARVMARRATRAEMLLAMADSRADMLADERDELVAEIGVVRKQLFETIEQRNAVREVADSLAEERDDIMDELTMLRGEPETDLEMAN
jgi:uncharacterized coiled-coil DUF342 family protein